MDSHSGGGQASHVGMIIHSTTLNTMAKVIAEYGGEKFNPSDSGDELAYKVLSSSVRSVSYHYDPEQEQANTISVLI